jgi:hypothetical protein
MSLLIKHIPPAHIDWMLNSPRSLRYQVPHLKDRAKQDMAAGDTLAYHRTMQRLTWVEQEIDRQDALVEKALREEREKVLRAEQKKR